MEIRMLTEPEGYVLLDRFGIPLPAYRIVLNAGEAARSSTEIGFPVVIKIISRDVVHKTDVGGVITDISTDQQAAESFETVSRNVRENIPEAEISGVIVEKQVPSGLEMIIGGKTDPTFGKVITIGFGGVYVELLKDIAIRVLPVPKEELKEMIRQLRGYPMIQGFRRYPARDEEALLDLLLKVVSFFSEERQVVEFDLNPVILHTAGVYVVDARIYVTDQPPEASPEQKMPVSPQIFYPSSIAVIGASSDPTKVGYAILRNLLSFTGALYPVNPHHKELLSRVVYPSVLEIPGTIDLAVIAIPAEQVTGVMRELGRKGVKLAVIISSGFRETGEEGRMREMEVLRIAREQGIRIMGPNCLGLVLPRQAINTTFDPVSPLTGHIGFISQSGAIITTIVDWSLTEDIGFSGVISIGNQIDLGFVEFLQFLSQDQETRAIILYVEEIKNGSEFMETVKEVISRKPIIALKSGSSRLGKKAASSHTGSLAGSYEIYRAAFLQCGIIQAYSISETFDIAELLVSEGYPHGRKSIVITAAGGFAVLASDYAEEYGIDLIDIPSDMMEELNSFLPPIWSHENPMDIIGDGGAERYARVFDVLIRHQDIWDIAFVIAVPSAVLDSGHLAQEICRFSRHTDKMIVGCLLGGDSMRSGMRILQNKGVPNYSDIRAAFRAVGRTLAGMKSISQQRNEPLDRYEDKSC
jgi:acetyl coenzyme A synthetase (ADP forming)-like protein